MQPNWRVMYNFQTQLAEKRSNRQHIPKEVTNMKCYLCRNIYICWYYYLLCWWVRFTFRAGPIFSARKGRGASKLPCTHHKFIICFITHKPKSKDKSSNNEQRNTVPIQTVTLHSYMKYKQISSSLNRYLAFHGSVFSTIRCCTKTLRVKIRIHAMRKSKS